jgi:hypothetical protein
MGSGKYTIQDQMPQENMLAGLGPKTIPAFGPESVVITKREFVGDIKTSAVPGAFSTQSFPIQPGNPTSFPWLSNIASAYTEWSMQGLVYEFISSSSDSVISSADNTSLGTVVLSTNYDSLAYTTNVQCQNSEFAVSGKCSNNLLHMVECKYRDGPLSTLYVRTGAVPPNRDIRLYDQGVVQCSISGNQGINAIIGQLYVSYKIVFKKAILPGAISLAYQAPILFAFLNYGDITSGSLGRFRTLLLGTASAGTKYQPMPALNVPSFYVPNQYMTYGLSNVAGSTQSILSFFALGMYRVKMSYDLLFVLNGADAQIYSWRSTLALAKEVGNSHTYPTGSAQVDGSCWHPLAAIPLVTPIVGNGICHRSLDVMLNVTEMNDVAVDGRLCYTMVPCFGSGVNAAPGSPYIMYNNIQLTVEFLNGV